MHLHLRDASLQMNGKMHGRMRGSSTSVPEHGDRLQVPGWASWYQEGAAAEASALAAPRLAVLASLALAHLSDSALQASIALMYVSGSHFSRDSLAHSGCITTNFRRAMLPRMRGAYC